MVNDRNDYQTKRLFVTFIMSLFVNNFLTRIVNELEIGNSKWKKTLN